MVPRGLPKPAQNSRGCHSVVIRPNLPLSDNILTPDVLADVHECARSLLGRFVQRVEGTCFHGVAVITSRVVEDQIIASIVAGRTLFGWDRPGSFSLLGPNRRMLFVDA